jgi:hypothetical protein
MRTADNCFGLTAIRRSAKEVVTETGYRWDNDHKVITTAISESCELNERLSNQITSLLHR